MCPYLVPRDKAHILCLGTVEDYEAESGADEAQGVTWEQTMGTPFLQGLPETPRARAEEELVKLRREQTGLLEREGG